MSKPKSFLTPQFFKYSAFVSIGIGASVFVVFLILLGGNYEFSGFNLSDDSIDLTYKVGSFIGAIVGPFWALAGVFLFYNALDLQKKDLKESQKTSVIQSFESVFFNLLKNQQDLSMNIEGHFITYKKMKFEYLNPSKRDFFRISVQVLNVIFESLKNDNHLGYFDQEEADHYESLILESPYVEYWEKKDQIKKETLHHREKIINRDYSLDVDVWKKLKNKSDYEKILKSYELFLSKHHDEIGHYFRHFYNILKFIDSSKKDFCQRGLNFDHEKYVNFIQAQMSSYELSLLFYNILFFPKAKELVLKYNILDNLVKDDLVAMSDFEEQTGISIKTRAQLFDSQFVFN